MNAPTAVPLAHTGRAAVRVMPHLPDAQGRHMAWNEDLGILAISAELFQAVRVVAGMVTAPTLTTRQPQVLTRGYRPTVDDLGLLVSHR